MKLSYYLLCAAVLAASAFLSCGGPEGAARSVSLNGQWSIIIGDGAEYARRDFEDREWDAITLPGSIIGHVAGKRGPASGVVWVRRHFPGNAVWDGKGAGLSLGKIGNADRAYVNGVLVGATGGFPPRDAAMWNTSRFYFVPPGIITGGDNVIALRIAYSLFGEVRGDLSVSDMHTWESKRDRSFLLQMINYAVMAVCGAMGLIFLLIYIRRPGWMEYRYFLLQLLPGFFVVYETCGVIPIVNDTLLRIKILGFMWTVLVVFHLGFLHRLYGIVRRGVESMLWLLLFVNTILLSFGSDLYRHRWIGIFVIITVTPLALYNLTVHMTALRRRSQYAGILIVPGAVLSLGAAHDGIVYLSWALGREIRIAGYRFDEIIFGYCAAMMFLGAALILVHRFINALNETEDLNRNLEKRVGERTDELRKRVKELSTMVDAMHLDQRVERSARGRTSIAPATEEKIRNAIVYIHENYMFDISREGLASLAELNHDHFGKAFRIYTGKKFQDYINDLRIKSAAVMLRETDKKIIDIAFDSGFESLRTFNRAFILHKGVSPTEYRKKGG